MFILEMQQNKSCFEMRGYTNNFIVIEVKFIDINDL